MAEPLQLSLEICYLREFEKTVTLIIQDKVSQFTVNKRNQLVTLILDRVALLLLSIWIRAAGYL